MRKTPIALYQVHTTEDGFRIYLALNRQGEILDSVKVVNCGYGGMIAREKMGQKYAMNGAEWTFKAIDLFKKKYEEGWLKKYAKPILLDPEDKIDFGHAAN